MTTTDKNERKFISRELITTVTGVLLFVGGAYSHAEKKIDEAKAEALDHANQKVIEIRKEIDNERQERQEATRQINSKLDLIITIVTTGRKT